MTPDSATTRQSRHKKRTLGSRYETHSLARRGLVSFEPTDDLRGVRELDLSGNQLVELSSEIALLKDLRVLHLGLNQLAHLPPEIGHLTKLEVLDLSYNNLKALPSEIGQLRALTDLVLVGNKLEAVPHEIGELKALLRLNLAGNGLTKIPLELCELTALLYLGLGVSDLDGARRRLPEYADHRMVSNKETHPAEKTGEPSYERETATRLEARANSIVRVPSEIRSLSQLRSLDLTGNRLEALPSEIVKLGHLVALRISDNRLLALPPDFGRLRRFEHLDASNNMLEEMPPSFPELTRLRSLSLDNNWLTAVPDLRRCHRLQTLRLDGNRLSDLPAWIGSLGKLQWLSVRDNRITSLPTTLAGSGAGGSRLKSLWLERNELHSLPGELGGLSDVVDLRISGNPLQEPLSSLVEAGRSSLLAYLRSLADAEPLYEAKVLLVGEGEVGKSSLRDALMGEPWVEKRSTTHGIELRRMVVSHPAEEDVEISLNLWDFGGQAVYRITHQFFFGRRAIYLLVWKPREGAEENALASWCRRIHLRIGDDAAVLIVATHANERRQELDYLGLQKRFGGMLVGRYAIDSFDGRGLNELRQAVAASAARLPQMGELLSGAWRRARDEVLSSPEPQIAYAEFETICRRHKLMPDAIKALAALLHELGHIVHYGDDEGLSDVMVLKPEWLTKAISYVLEDETTERCGGVLEHRRLAQIWGGTPDRLAYPAKYHPYFLRLMEKFDVSYRIPDEDASLVGQLVRYERPDFHWTAEGSGHGQRTLSVVCHLDEPTDGLMAWFTVRHHRFSVGKHWRTGVLLERSRYGSRALFEQLDDHGQEFMLTVRGPSPDALFNVFREGLEYLMETRWPELSFELLVPCRGTLPEGRVCDFRFTYRNLRKYRERGRPTIDCHSCGAELDVAELLTGFPQPDVSLRAELDAVNERIRNMAGSVGQVASGVAEIQRDTAEIKSMTAQSGHQIRLVLRAIDAEVDDCPRLFTLTTRRKPLWHALKLHERWYQLTLWCEHSDHEHPWQLATYTIRRHNEWAAEVAPYAALVVKTLRLVVPIATAGANLAVSTRDYAAASEEINFTNALVQSLQEPSAPEGLSEQNTQNGLTRAEGAGARALREVLFQHDSSRAFGGLRRRQISTGEFLWVCPEHYGQYDPGLPELPGEGGHDTRGAA